jgi:hypothetical protein
VSGKYEGDKSMVNKKSTSERYCKEAGDRSKGIRRTEVNGKQEAHIEDKEKGHKCWI